jgi:hypothetical protein
MEGTPNKNDIPPRDFGKLEATVEGLEKQFERTVTDLNEKITTLTTAVNTLTETMNQAKGGWKIALIIGGAVSGITVLLLKILGFLKGW